MWTFPLSKMVGGIFYEHLHRLVASTVGFLIVVLAVWLYRAEPRPWVRRLGYLALAAVVQLPIGFDPSLDYVGAMLYLAIVSSILGFGAYLTLIGRIGADRAAYSSVLFPIVALAISTAFEGYRWSPEGAVGVVLILVGNLVALTRTTPRTAQVERAPRSASQA